MEELFNSPYALPIAAFIAISILAWAVIDYFTSSAGASAADNRLDMIRRNQKTDRPSEKEEKNGFSKLIDNATPLLSDAIKPKTEEEADTLKTRLSQAGFRGENSAAAYLATKTFLLAIGVVIGVSCVLLFTDGALLNWALGVGGGLLMFFIPDFVLGSMTKSRKEAIFLGLPDALDLMVVCVEAGLGLDHAMKKVAEETVDSCPILSKEITTCNNQMQMGRSREEVLRNLGARNGVDDLTTLAQMLIQADRFGTSISQALRVQSDALRIRRRQRAEEKASKTAVQLLFPLVLFIFPGIFVVLVGPAAINIIDNMLT